MLKCDLRRDGHSGEFLVGDRSRIGTRKKRMQFRAMRSRWRCARSPRLLFEELERRDLLAVMRIVDWNTFNEPNNATDDANFRTVLEAIGNETAQGNAQRIDILALQETDPPGAGDSIGRVQNILNSLYATTSYNVVASGNGIKILHIGHTP